MTGPTGVAVKQNEKLFKSLQAATVGEYEILGELGSGGMATVFLAHDIALSRKVALKVMSPALIAGNETAERFRREALTAASLSHPNIIPIYAVKENNDLFFIVMKAVEGRTLGSIIEEVGTLPIPMVQAILGQVGGALGYAHRRGVVHRDVKPDNIMIDDEGWAVVTDFGIAKLSVASDLTASGAVVGTPTYMSPEQCAGEPVTGASDQYSLGVVAYHMLTGKPPFTSQTLMGMLWGHVNEHPTPLPELRPDCPTELASVVLRMLEKRPEDRFPSVEEAVAAIGVTPLAHDDPIRTSLIGLAKTGESAELIAKVRTPASPVPFGQATRPSAGTEEIGARSRILRWGAVAAAIVSVGGIALWLTLGGGDGVTVNQPPPAPIVSPIDTTAPVASITVAGPERPIEVGTSVALSATPVDEDGNAISGHDVVWETSDPAVANVSDDGVVSGISPGTAQVTVRSETHSTTVPIRIGQPAPPTQAPAVQSVTVRPASRMISVGEPVTLRAFATDADGARVPGPGGGADWSSSDSAIAVVSLRGVVTGVSAGSAVITATLRGLSGEATVTVVSVAVAQIDVTAPAGALLSGDSVSLNATVRASDGRQLMDHPVTWLSTDSTVAVVSQGGLVTGVNAGRALIVASSGGTSASVPIVVEDQPADRVPAAEIQSAVEATIGLYANALQARDMDALKRVYPNLTPVQEGAWVQIFELGELMVSIADLEVFAVSADSAQTTFQQTIEGRRLERNTTTFTATLIRTPDGWRIISIR